MDANRQEHIEYAQPQTLGAREEVAASCTVGLKLSIPTLIDTMDNAADHAFQGWPERLVVLSPEGRLVYKGGKGPYGFNPEALEGFLAGYLLSVAAPPAE